MKAPDNHHYFVSSVGTWRTGTDLHELMRQMDREQLSYNAWLLPVPEDTDYEIKMFCPQVKGAVWLGFTEFKSGRRVKEQA